MAFSIFALSGVGLVVFVIRNSENIYFLLGTVTIVLLQILSYLGVALSNPGVVIN